MSALARLRKLWAWLRDSRYTPDAIEYIAEDQRNLNAFWAQCHRDLCGRIEALEAKTFQGVGPK